MIVRQKSLDVHEIDHNGIVFQNSLFKLFPVMVILFRLIHFLIMQLL